MWMVSVKWPRLMSTVPWISRVPVSVSHLMGFLFTCVLKFPFCTMSALIREPEEPESIRPR